MAKKVEKSPNYVLVLALGIAGAAISGIIGKLALHLGLFETGGLSAVGFILGSGSGLVRSAASDAGRTAVQLKVKKNIDRAYEQQSLGRLAEAEKLLLEALERSNSLDDHDLLRLSATHSLGNLYRLQNKSEQAEEKYRQALKAYELLQMTEDRVYAQCLRDLATILRIRGLAQESLEVSQQALVIFEKLGEKREIAEILTLVAHNTRACGLLEQAVQVFGQVKDIQIQQFGESATEVLETELALARILTSLNKLNEAISSYKDVLIRLNKSERPPRTLEAEALLEMAEVSLQQGQFKNVEALCLGSLKVLQNFVGAQDKLLQRLVTTLGSARTKLNQSFSETEFLLLFAGHRDQVRDVFRNQVDLARQKDRIGWGSLQWAIFLGWDDLTRWLMRNGALTDDFESGVMSPAHVAAAWGKGATITFLAENNVPLDPVGPQGWSPVHYAAYHGKQDCLEQLLTRGADATRLDAVGRSALHLAADRGHAEVVAYLLSKELNKDQVDNKYGYSPLHLAAFAGYGGCVRTLMMNGADENCVDKRGKTPINLAEEAGNSGLVSAMKHFRSVMDN